jgi:hypothetical protein
MVLREELGWFLNWIPLGMLPVGGWLPRTRGWLVLSVKIASWVLWMLLLIRLIL